MVEREEVKEYFDYYRTQGEIDNIEDVAKVIIKCKILDDRETKYNIIGFDFEELVYGELLDLQVTFCADYMTLIEYALYFEQKKQNLKMIQEIYKAISYMNKVIDKTGEKRKRCKYIGIIKILMKYEKAIYGNKLLRLNGKEKEKYIRNDILNNAGELLFYLQYYRLTNLRDEDVAEEYWTCIMKLAQTIDKVALQDEIEINEEFEESMKLKIMNYSGKLLE